jgi:hypothetical protein
MLSLQINIKITSNYLLLGETYCSCLLFSSDFNQNFIISTDRIEFPQCEMSRKSV